MKYPAGPGRKVICSINCLLGCVSTSEEAFLASVLCRTASGEGNGWFTGNSGMLLLKPSLLRLQLGMQLRVGWSDPDGLKKTFTR